MTKVSNSRLVGSLIFALLVTACNDDYFEDWTYEMYTRNFIKEFGLVNPEQDWNMASTGNVTLNIGNQPADAQVYAQYGFRYYLVADLKNVRGAIEVPFDMPKGCQDVKVVVNGTRYVGRIGEIIDCTGHGARSRSEITDTGTSSGGNEIDFFKINYTPSSPGYTKAYGGLNVTVSQSTKYGDNGYLYFNSRQMDPILNKGVWADYYSLTDRAMKCNDNSSVGILPEIGTENRTKAQGNADKHPNVVLEDFVFQIKDPQEGFDIFPMFYGSNLRHTLGFYLVDEKGDPVKDDNGFIIRYPIYESKHGDDIKVKKGAPLPEGDQNNNNGKTIKVKTADGTYLTKNSNNAYVLSIYTNEAKKISLVFYDSDGNEYTPSSYSVKFNGDVPNWDGANATVTPEGSSTAMSAGSSVNNMGSFNIWSQSNISDWWVKFEVTIDGTSTDVNLVVAASARPATTNVKRIEFFDGDNIISDPVYTGVTLTSGTSKTYTVKCYDATTGGNVVSSPAHLKVGNWHTSIFTATLNGDQLTITGVSGSAQDGNDAGVQWTTAYIDLDEDSGPDDNEPSKSLKVTVNDPVIHSHTETINLSNSQLQDLVPSFDGYFNEASSGSSSSSNTEVEIWSGNKTLGWDDSGRLSLSTSDFTNKCSPSDYTHLKVEGSGDIQVLIFSGDNDTYIAGSSLPHEFSLTEGNHGGILSNINSAGIRFQGNGSVTRVSLVNKGTSSAPVAGSWKDSSNGPTTMANALKSYYAGLTQSYTCDQHNGDGVSLSSTDSGVTRNITANVSGDNKNNVTATVTITLSKTETTTNAPRRNSPKAKSSRSGISSRAEGDDLIAPGGALFHDDNTEWDDIQLKFNQDTKSVDAYNYKTDVLVRSRGYHVDLTDVSTNKNYYGYIGFYIVYDWGTGGSGTYDLEAKDASVNTDWQYAGDPGRPKSRVHYSQKALNITKTSDGKEFPISYAATFKHPMSQNQYLCFEDWTVTVPVGNSDTDGNLYTGSFNTTNFWDNIGKKTENGNTILENTGNLHYSSDRDLNDIIFRQYGLVPIRTSELSSQRRGFDWIWALEDLGATDDFDFNDVVILLNSITTTNTEKSSEQGSDEAPDAQSTTVKEVTLTPLAAGGTLPVYVHFKYNHDNHSDDIVLAPTGNEKIDLTAHDIYAANGNLIKDDGLEFHKWFGNYESKTMINTGRGATSYNLNSCRLIIPNNYHIAGVPLASNNFTYTIDGINGFPFYVTINGPHMETTQESINQDADRLNKTNDTYLVGMPEKGAAAQSFIIVGHMTDESTSTDENVQDTNNSVTYAYPWYWPSERSHILDAYPNFSDWLSDPSNQTWWSNKVNNYIYNFDYNRVK